MAIQMHVCYSGTFMGIGIIAGAPYWCAMDNVNVALTSCTKDGALINLSALYAATDYAFATDTIDDPRNLARSRAWAFSGLEDTVVEQAVMDKTITYYQHYLPKGNIEYVNTYQAEHAWITDSYGNACDFLGFPYINNCKLDAAGQLLNFVYDGAMSNRTQMNTTNLQQFDQTAYTPADVPVQTLSLSEAGFIYVPTACQDRTTECKLHVFFHGCGQGIGDAGDLVAMNTGLNQWAEANNIIVLYPQAVRSQVAPYNPMGCWDWWGYTAPSYASKLGPQIVTVRNMINAITGGKLA